MMKSHQRDNQTRENADKVSHPSVGPIDAFNKSVWSSRALQPASNPRLLSGESFQFYMSS